MRQLLRDQSLTIVTLGLFLLFLGAQAITGERVYNADRLEHGEPAVTFVTYLRSGHFVEATFENWESEFLQMGAYVLLTAFLIQRGSAESRDPDQPKSAQDAEALMVDSPWAAKQPGAIRFVYENSLTITLFAIFVVCFLLHAWGGAKVFSEGQIAHGGTSVSMRAFLQTSQFWFESFQNWQSEFLAVAALVVLSIFLRQRGSPESKPVNAPRSSTGA
jgi:hypothetical protein